MENLQEEETIPIVNELMINAMQFFLSNVHQVKGLEIPLVFILGVSDKRFPIPNRSHGTSFDDSVASRYGTTDADERRLFYVALTRAKEHLVIGSYINKGKESSFLVNEGQPTIINPETSAKHIYFSKSKEEENREDEIVSIGISDLLILMECPFQYYLRRIFGIYPPVGDELGYGRSLHEIIQLYQKWRRVSPEK
jgi:DNA helicase-2/ATP-dependent DNA helicase PcrA